MAFLAFSNATKSLLEQKPSASVLRVAAVLCSPRNGGKVRQDVKQEQEEEQKR